MCLATIVISATGNVPSLKERDAETNRPVVGSVASIPEREVQGHALLNDAVDGQLDHDGSHHGGRGTAAFSIPGSPTWMLVSGVRAQQTNDMADALSAALWLTEPVMYVPESDVRVAAELPEARPVDRPISSPRYGGISGENECYADILARYEWDVATMKAIFWRESHCLLDPPHNNLSRGICQLYMPVHAWRVAGIEQQFLTDPETAIRICHDIYVDAGGYSPWAY